MMGTNYYLHKPACPHCGHSDDPLHIGKCSACWCFSLHVHDWPEIRNLDGWIFRWNAPDAIIKDEYGRTIEPAEMLKIICERGRGPDATPLSLEWYRANGAIPGPNNLARHRIDGQYCVGHGKGTWDFIQGDFS